MSRRRIASRHAFLPAGCATTPEKWSPRDAMREVGK